MARKIIEDMELLEFSAVNIPAQEPALASITKASDMEKAKTKTEDGQEFPASDYAYVPDSEKPSTWKLRLTSTPGGDPDPRIVGAAAAALGPGFRGNRVEIPAADRAKVVARVRRAWVAANPDKDRADMPEALKTESKAFDVGLIKGLTKRYIDPADGIVSFVEVVSQNMKERAFYEESEKFSPYLWALHTALCSIAGEASIDNTQRYTMMRNQIESFMEVLRGLWVGVDEVLAPFVEYTEESGMTDATEKTEKADTAQVDALTKQLEAAQEELKSLKAVAALTVDELTFYKSLDEAGQKAFIEKSVDDRAKDLRKAADDETVQIEGRTIRKSVVGDDMFEIMKAQAARLEKSEKVTAEERQKRELAEFTKAADEKYSKLPGTSLEKGKALAELSKCSAETQDTLEKMLKASNGAMEMAFGDLGEKDGSVEKFGKDKLAKDQDFLNKVDELVASQKLNRSDAMAKARKQYPEEFKAYQESNS